MAAIFVTPNLVAFGIIAQPDHTQAPVPISATALKLNSLEFEAIKDAAKTANTGKVYIGSATMNTSTGVGVLKTLSPGEQWSFANTRDGNPFDASKICMQNDTNNDAVRVSGIIR